MTQEEKELLLKDLCARLPYGVMIQHPELFYPSRMVVEKLVGIDGEHINDDGMSIEYVKPYLRPMSSMTEEEEIKLYQIAGFYYLSNNELLKDEWRQFLGALSENKLLLPYPIWGDDLQKVFDWLDANHFDHRGLIPMGLALEALEGMYNIKTMCDNCKNGNYCSQSEYVKTNCWKLKN